MHPKEFPGSTKAILAPSQVHSSPCSRRLINAVSFGRLQAASSKPPKPSDWFRESEKLEGPGRSFVERFEEGYSSAQRSWPLEVLMANWAPPCRVLVDHVSEWCAGDEGVGGMGLSGLAGWCQVIPTCLIFFTSILVLPSWPIF